MYSKQSGDETLLAVLNFSGEKYQYKLPDGVYTNALTGKTLRKKEGALPPYGFSLFIIDKYKSV